MRQQATGVLFADDVGEIRYVWGRAAGGSQPPRWASGGVTPRASPMAASDPPYKQ